MKSFLLTLTIYLLPHSLLPHSAIAQDTSNIHSELNAVVSTYVNKSGLVNYAALKSNQKLLKSYLKKIEDLSPAKFKEMSENHQLAYWINAYNAFTLKLIIDNYPIKSSFLKSALWPKNSIKQIDGAWDQKNFKAMGRTLSLNQVEHEIIRVKYDEPRIHMALVCAAISCPLLRNEAYLGEKLDAQLTDQSTKFVNNPKKFKIGSSSVELSSIFKWYGKDFVSKHQKEGQKYASWGISKDEQAVLAFAEPLLSEANKKALKNSPKAVSYIKYNWALNEQ